ncbi:SDR family oxidoreductase [Methylotenera sp.]|uniref:SDR family oxidoreductase n=1 Tax=Methylotenera sp. TaxID=2051956 RepID=UPI002487C41F|nr:SDR family oxidoreductase [Methylotenera sp.]MDI1299819.1 SDR family oxidoreductase [Methylotenera sp.]
MKVFITGASSGIGEALATEYAKRYENTDSTIGLVARRSEHLQKLQFKLQESYKVKCAIYPLDVRNHQALASAATDFMQQHGTPDIVIACAGVSRGTLTEHVEDIAAFQAIMDINVMGLVHTFQPFIESMRKAGQGQLVGVASVAGIRGLPGAGAYSASKAAAISYLESLRVEMAPDNIAVTTIAPGYIRTPMTNVNQYKMPFLMDADVFADKFANAVENKRRFCVIPWQMGWVARLMRLIPPFIWDFAVKKAPHKKRLDWDWL